MAYPHKFVEAKWQKFWDEKQVFKSELDPSKPKYYVLDMFPYPSGSGLHVGHPEGYTATDILARYKRTRGFSVLHPMGWDAFGLPAEQHAIQTGTHPAITTAAAIENFRRQLKMLGFSYDWTREISTCEPKYYKWTQWIFKRLYDKGLAYQKEVPVNWCPALKTVLANEEVIDGKSERGGHPVFRQPMKQWMLKITDYAERLIKDLDGLDWPEGTKELQRNWIGKSEGLQYRFPLIAADGKSAGEEIEVFTTRPDTIYGATYLVLAPEHPLVVKITTLAEKAKVAAYVDASSRKSEIARQEQTKEKTGAFTGAYATNPFNQTKIPVWVADYVMMGYGTGAIMAVPAHDVRDSEFAAAFSLRVLEVVKPLPGSAEGDGCFSGEGTSINSGEVTGLPTAEAKNRVIAMAEAAGLGKRTVNYKLRDWLFSRQRYWGEPFPVIHLDDGSKETLPDDLLPVALPDVKSYEPSGTGESPLAGVTEWLFTTDPRTGKKVRRETDTMPGSAGSSWYFLRYCDPNNESEPWSKEAEKYWMPVDLYLGGPEHAVGHLLYSRFWTKVLYDAGLVTHHEPFQRLVHQGMILGEDGEKMSKSRGNVINPDDVVSEYGADTLRLYEMFMGPLDQDKPWSTTAITGTFRFLQRAWRIFMDSPRAEASAETRDFCIVKGETPTEDDLRMTHKTIQKVTEDIEALRFNTAISQMMVFVNHFTKEGRSPRQCLKPFVQLLYPFAPHMAEELWEAIGETALLTYAPWPNFEPKYVVEDKMTIAIQVLGKTRGTVEVLVGTDQAAIEKAAREIPQVSAQLEGKTVKKLIFVQGKIMNFVVG
ncbi:MAG: leucine--tRNA ligase [Cryobacterium sp.]|nr:leucine--tRNA ligase [Oligoflexia bacterium]